MNTQKLKYENNILLENELSIKYIINMELCLNSN